MAAYAAALAASIVVAAVAPAHAADAEGVPRLTLSAPSVVPGASVIISGDRFPTNTSAQVVLCGDLALAGSADCDMLHARVAGTDGQGHFATELSVALPPSLCPCVIQASSLALPSAITTPITLVGAPSSAPRGVTPTAVTKLKVKVSLDGSGPALSWFGAQPKRTLLLDVTNPGTVAISPVMELHVGKGSNPATSAPSPDLGTLAPGETRTYKIPVELDAFAIGSYTASGTIKGAGDPVTFKASTGTFPWGLLAGGLVVIQLVLLAIRDRARRRLAPEAVAPMPAIPSTVISGSATKGSSAGVPTPPATRVVVLSAQEPDRPALSRMAPRRVATPLPEVPEEPAAVRELRELAELFAATAERSQSQHSVPPAPNVVPGGYDSMQTLPHIDPLAYWASPLLTPRAVRRAHLTTVEKAS
jgi:hypothetical protein